jgi:hypothetical protein
MGYFTDNIDMLRNSSVTTGLTGYIKQNLGLRSSKEEFDDSTPSTDTSGQTSIFGNIFGDASGQDVSGQDISGLKADTATAAAIARKTSQAAQEVTAYTSLYVNWIITYGFFILWMIFTIIIGSLAANHLIYYPWHLRLFAFAFIVTMGYFSDYTQLNTVYFVFAYYLISALYTGYKIYKNPALKGKENVLPTFFAAVPLRTANGTFLDSLLFLFTYLQQGNNKMDTFYNELITKGM